MQLEQQVCSLDLAKRLKELGVKQESSFYWSRTPNHDLYTDYEEKYPPALEYGEPEYKNAVSAFTVAELGEILPRLTNYRIWQQHSTDTSKLAGKWAITINDVKNDKFTDLTDDTEADARAKILIYLLENKLIN